MKQLLIFVAFVMSFSLMAGEARIDVSGSNSQINLKAVSRSKGSVACNPGWIKDDNKRSKYIYFTSPSLKKDEWQDVEFAFTADKDGKVVLSVGGQWYNVKKEQAPMYAYFKNIMILEGATLVNGDFKEYNEDGSITYWSYNKKGQHLPEVSEEDGEKIVKMQYNSRIKQTIEVQEGVTVKVKATVKLAMP